MEKASETIGLKRWAQNAGVGLRQIAGMITNFPKNMHSIRRSDALLLATFTGVGASVCGGALLFAGPAMAGIQALGFMAGGVGLLNHRLQHNATKLAVQPIASAGLAVQTALLGGFGYAVMAGVAGARAWIFSMIPDEKKFAKLRTGIALGFAGVGISAITALSFVTGRFENMLTVPSMLLGTVADRVPSSVDPEKDQTRYARLFRTAANANNTVFNALFTQSWAAVFSDAVGTGNLVNAIRDYDVPVQQKDGEVMRRRDSLSAYFTSLAKGAPAKGITPFMQKTQATCVDLKP